MGTRATTQITDSTDAIFLYTRWDGFPEEIRADVKNIVSKMEQFIAKAQERINERHLDHMQPWLNGFSNRLNAYKNKKDIRDIAFFLSCFDFNHHHPLTWDDTPECYVHVAPDQKISFRHRNPRITPTPPSYNTIIRLNGEHDDRPVYIGLIDMDVSTFIRKIFELPSFLRDMYEIIKTPIHEFKTLGDYPIFRNIYKFTQLYIGTANYDEWDKASRCDVTNAQSRLDYSLKNANAMLPIELYNASFATIIQLMCPEHIRYITDAERANIKADLEVTIFDRVASVAIPDDGSDSFELDMLEHYKAFLERERVWTEKHNVKHQVAKIEISEEIFDDGRSYAVVPIVAQLLTILNSQYDVELQATEPNFTLSF